MTRYAEAVTSYSYSALTVVQQPDAPAFYLTSVAAAELLEWCDVPRAKGDYMAGYQRILDSNRTKDLTRYLELSPSNIVPGAVIVAIDDDYVNVESNSDGLATIRIVEDTRDFNQKLQELWGGFTSRLTEEELKSAEIPLVAPPSSVEAIDLSEEPPVGEGATSVDDDWFESEGDPSEFDGDSAPAFPTSYLASLAQELSAAISYLDEVPEARQQAIQKYIDGVSKPGLIIDGQHRVFGAKDVSAHDVILPVVLIPGLPFSEQVFQFYVLNSKARPLRPTELRRIVSTSLTNGEIEDLYDRFRAAGIQAERSRGRSL